MHQKFTLLTTGMYDLQHTDQPCPQPGCGHEQQQCPTHLSNHPDHPQLPINHLILTLTAALLDAIQENNIIELTAINHLYRQSVVILTLVEELVEELYVFHDLLM